MRQAFVVFHRWVGLLIAGFLFISGVTGVYIWWKKRRSRVAMRPLPDTKTGLGK